MSINPILVLIVQNEFDNSIVGTATACTNFFREIGATLGASIIGSIFTANLSVNLSAGAAQFGSALQLDADSLTPAIVHALDPMLQTFVQFAYNDALAPAFFVLAPLFVIGFVMVLFLRNTPLAATNADSGHMD